MWKHAGLALACARSAFSDHPGPHAVLSGMKAGGCITTSYEDHQAEVGTYKVPIKSEKIVGICTSRGSREYQEDATSVHALQLNPEELKQSLERHKAKWDPATAGSEFLAGQTAYFGIFDGSATHGGKDVSALLKSRLHELIETVKPASIESIVEYTQTHGGYFKRWRGGVLQRWTKDSNTPRPAKGSNMTIDERLVLAFLEADKEVLTTVKTAERCGSTGTIVLLQSLDEPTQPYWAAKKLHLIIGHVGDTRALLCRREHGDAVTMTERHHAEARVEATRLRRMGAGRLVMDSFGESRWMGAIENTRGFGDGQYKESGVTAEAEVITRVLNGEDYAYLILVTDGITSLMSDQEIVDLARNAADPTRAAKTIVHFGEDLGAQDNCTCIVVPLAGWGKVGGVDTTEERREYRRKQADQLNTRMQRM